jgi:hypothetical protein
MDTLAANVSTGLFLSFASTVGLGLLLAFATLLVRHLLPRSFKRPSGLEDYVRASFFGDRLHYFAQGPIAEFVILLTAIAFVGVVFWLVMGVHGGE